MFAYTENVFCTFEHDRARSNAIGGIALGLGLTIVIRAFD
jgi:hypothetical protein